MKIITFLLLLIPTIIFSQLDSLVQTQDASFVSYGYSVKKRSLLPNHTKFTFNNKYIKYGRGVKIYFTNVELNVDSIIEKSNYEI
jgi:hypothetical protein